MHRTDRVLAAASTTSDSTARCWCPRGPGRLGPADPRSIATLDAYLAHLTEDGYAYRFRHDHRRLDDAEGAFLFLRVHRGACAVHLRPSGGCGALVRAQTACGPPGRYAEEYDVGQRQLRGNLPQRSCLR